MTTGTGGRGGVTTGTGGREAQAQAKHQISLNIKPPSRDYHGKRFPPLFEA